MFGKLKKEKKQNEFLNWYDVGSTVERRKKLLKKLMMLYNPMYSIEVGRFQEVQQARNLAQEIVNPLGLFSSDAESCKNILSILILFCLYRSQDEQYCFGTGYCTENQGDYLTATPTLDFLLDFLKGNFISEIYYDDSNEPFLEKKCYKFKSFADLVPALCDFSLHGFPYELQVECYLKYKNLNNRSVEDYIDTYKVNIVDIVNRYREHNTAIELGNTDIHPWITNSLYALSSLSDFVLNERAYQCTLAIEDYFDKHPYAQSYMIREIFEYNLDLFLQNPNPNQVRFNLRPTIEELNYHKENNSCSFSVEDLSIGTNSTGINNQ